MAYAVTIGIPVYNVEKYIRLTLDSALAQTFQDIEFLVCDDCGADSSMDIVRDYQQNHPRGKDIRIVRQPKNMGLGNARNRIIDEAQGRYLYHLDADDAIAPNTIDLLYRAAVKYGAQLVYGSYERIDELCDEPKHTVFRYPDRQFLEEDEFAQWAYRKYDGIQAQTWNFLIDIDVYRSNHLRHQPVNFWEDFSLTIDLPTYVSRVVLLSDVTYYYYCRSGSLSHFQQRQHIAREEVERTARAINQLKDKSDRIRSKSYFPKRMYKLMMTDFYMISTVLHHRDTITPPFTNRELRDIMRSPLLLSEIMHFKVWRKRNLVLYMLGTLPSAISVALMKFISQHVNFIKKMCFDKPTY